MSYIQAFKNDVFVSYAHADNEPNPVGVCWVDQFVRNLEVELRRRLGGTQDLKFFSMTEAFAAMMSSRSFWKMRARLRHSSQSFRRAMLPALGRATSLQHSPPQSANPADCLL
jgi:hypothetical protein